MYLISKLRLYLIFAVIAVLIILFTMNSYFVFVKLNSQPALSSKYFAENIVFYAMIVLGILAIVLANTVLRHKELIQELDKVVEISRKDPGSLRTQINKLGLLGEKISQVNANLNELNELKTLKISAQAHLIEFLLAEFTAWLILINTEGRILNLSRSLLDYLNLSEQRLRAIFLDELLSDTDPSQLINNLRRSKNVIVKSRIQAEHNQTATDSVWSFYPILNSKSDLVYCIGLLKSLGSEPMTNSDKIPISEKIGEFNENTQQTRVIERITDFVRSKFDRLKSDDNV